MGNILIIVVLFIASYLLGAIPFSFIAGKLLKGIDLREHGSKNLGATNVYRTLGTVPAIIVLLLDIGKGTLATLLPSFFLQSNFVQYYQLGMGLVAIIGHTFSIFVGFKGGKGVATSAGVFLALNPLSIGIAFTVWLILVITTRYVSLGSIIGAISLPVVIAIEIFILKYKVFIPIFVLSIIVAIFVIYKHKTNIGRLLNGTEKKFGQKEVIQ
jgi:glycerol-3-phosphate acyltransferase PlsY